MEVINVPLNIKPTVDYIFGAILVGGVDRSDVNNTGLLLKKIAVTKVATNWFRSQFQYNVFNGAQAVFWDIICTKKVNTLDKSQLEILLDNNKAELLESEYIDIKNYSISASGNIASDDDKFLAIKADIVDEFVRLSYLDVDIDTFKSSCIIYSDWYKEAFMENTCQNMAIIMQENGLNVKMPGKRPRVYRGSSDAQKYYNDRIRILKSLDGSTDNKTIVRDEAWLSERHKEISSNTDDEKLVKTGIKEIDNVMGELRRGRMLGILGAPKGGKTRLANYLTAVLIKNGFNVAVWPIEGSAREWLAMQTACTIALLSLDSKNSGTRDDIIRIPDEVILNKKYLEKGNGIRGNNDIASLILSTETILVTDKRFGKLSIIEEPAYAETFVDVLKGHYENVNPFDAIVIDPLINIGSLNHIAKVQRVTDAYTDFKRLIQKELPIPALGIVPAQLKQDTIDYLRAHPEATMDVTSGGESAETIRTPDDTIGLFSTKEERDSNIINIYSVASRHSGNFPDFTARCFLECCMFSSIEDA